MIFSPGLRASAVFAITYLAACAGNSTPFTVAVAAAAGPLRISSVMASVPMPLKIFLPDSAESGAPEGYHLVWADEFDVNGLPDAAKWRDDSYANVYSPKNGELQYYTSRRMENERVQDGYLYITARKEEMHAQPNYAGQRYSSARIITRDLAQWTNGFFEIRARLPCGAGAWPAVWTLGLGRWPDSGEIDIMEQLGKDPNTVYGTVHVKGNKATPVSTTVTAACTSFHNYQLEWTPEILKIGVDGVVYSTYENAHKGQMQWPFDSPEYLVLNVALGGSWAGAVDDANLPATMVVDYVRVYQK